MDKDNQCVATLLEDYPITSFMGPGRDLEKEPPLTSETKALTVRHAHIVPSILANIGENAATKSLESFAARIRNSNTREACACACSQFLSWSEQHVDDLRLITPIHVAAYIEKDPGSPQTIKQQLTAGPPWIFSMSSAISYSSLG
jgi:hypothetical protein